MKKLTLITLGILVLIGAAAGLVMCFILGEFSIAYILVPAGGMLIIYFCLMSMTAGDAPSPWANSWLYGTDFATGEIITELQKLNKK